MIRKHTMIRVAATIATTIIGIVTIPAAHAQSACKGLEQPACTANTACRFTPAIVAGEINPRTSKAYKVTRKAHCRAAPAPRASKSAKPAG